MTTFTIPKHRRGARQSAGLFEGLVVDLFAGGGGASLGIEAAIGRSVDIAVNHDREAIAMHAINHPNTRHLCEDVFAVDPIEATGGRPVDILWSSPDCKHFSKAKGGKPVSKRVRGLAWVVTRWASKVRPRLIMLENVVEFTTWGPLSADGRPCPKRKGRTFREWTGQLRKLGYDVQWRELKACDYGAPTIRKRFFLVARNDGKPIVWPTPTHGPNLKPYRTAAECIDWSLPCPSIFERERPLAEKTMRRIAAGIRRYVLEAADPFIVHATHHGKRRVHPVSEPMPTVTGANRGEMELITPFLTEHANGSGQRTFSADEPLRTQCANVKGGHFALVTPFLAGAGGPAYSAKPAAVDRPVGVITTENHRALVAPHLTKFRGNSVGSSIDAPVPTVTANSYVKRPGGAAPIGLASAFLSKFYGTNIGADLRQPMPTTTAGGNHIAEVRAFLLKYYGTDQDPQLREPMHTITCKHRFALGLVTIGGTDYQIIDIGMRMLAPRELARAQGFPDSYVLSGTKTSQVARIGNSVCPPLAEAVVRANLAA